jgi:L-asparaginase
MVPWNGHERNKKEREEKMNNKIIILNTGGTIAMERDELSEAVKPGAQQPLHSLLEPLKKYAHVEMKDLYNLPSPHMTPERMKELSRTIHHLSKEDQVQGIVITHGTDTLEETAFLLDLTLATDKPVIVTGAMRSNNELGADGPINLLESVRTAAHKNSWKRGTLVVFNNEIHAARYVTKTHTSSVATFKSPGTGPLGSITKKDISFTQSPYRQKVYQIQGKNHNVPLVKLVAGFDPAWLDFFLTQSIDGIVLEAFGAGNVPPAILPAIEQFIKKNIPVVMVSRCYNGYVQDLYDYEGGGKQLYDMGVIFCNGLNGQKARIKLLVLLDTLHKIDDYSPHFTV